MADDREYWIDRAIQREQEAYRHGSKTTAKLYREYERAAQDIRRQVNDFYGRYAGKYGLTYDQTVRALNRKEVQEWRMSLEAYTRRIEKETDPRVKALLTAQLDALSANSSITRLEAMQGQIDMILNDLYDKGVRQMRAEFGNAFVESYYHKAYRLQVRAGYLNEFAKISPRLVENAVVYPWSGAMFSDRLWQNKQTLIYHLREITTQGIILGKSPAALSKELSEKLGQSYKAAERVIRTETSHLHNEAEKAAYRAAGVTQYEIVGTLDERSCDECGAMDGKHFLVSEAQAGGNFPPFHPNCRCTTVAYDPEEAADWAASGVEMPKKMTWSEWKKAQGIDV